MEPTEQDFQTTSMFFQRNEPTTQVVASQPETTTQTLAETTTRGEARTTQNTDFVPPVTDGVVASQPETATQTLAETTTRGEARTTQNTDFVPPVTDGVVASQPETATQTLAETTTRGEARTTQNTDFVPPVTDGACAPEHFDLVVPESQELSSSCAELDHQSNVSLSECQQLACDLQVNVVNYLDGRCELRQCPTDDLWLKTLWGGMNVYMLTCKYSTYNAGIDFRRQNLTSKVDSPTQRVKYL